VTSAGGAVPTISQSLRDPHVQRLAHAPLRELAQFSWLAGTWRAASDTYVFAPTMNGRWLFGADGKSSYYYYISFDPFTHQYVLVRLESTPSYSLSFSSQGWTGNRIVFTSALAYANGRPYRRRVTIEEKGARSFTISDDEQRADGTWTNDDTIDLTKQ